MGIKKEVFNIPGYEEVVYGEDEATGMRSIIAIHNRKLGPACGGLRMLDYKSPGEALTDVLRLAKGMAYKSSLAGIGFGGGKSVLIGDPATKKTPELFQSFGRFVDSFNGRYIAAKDMNVSTADLLEVQKTTKHVLGMEGVPGSSGDPSPVTAHGIFRAIEATVEELDGKKSVKGLKFTLQGIGHVGWPLAVQLRKEGAELVVTDIDEKVLERAKRELGAKVVSLDAIYDEPCDIFSPGARGAILNPQTIPRLKCRAICGAANNQLLTLEDGDTLHKKGILYAPDFAVNSGGIINIFIELGGYTTEKAIKKADEIYSTMRTIYQRARAEGKPPYVIADRLAEERMGLK